MKDVLSRLKRELGDAECYEVIFCCVDGITTCWLRGLPVDKDITLNLLSAELVAP